MVHSNHCHRFSCSVMLGLGFRGPIALKWPAAVLVFWPHFNGNAQRPAQRHGQFGINIYGRCFLRGRGYVVFCAQATGIQEGNQTHRGAAKKSSRGIRIRTVWSAPTGVFGSIQTMPAVFGSIQNANASRPKSTESVHRCFGSASADLIFLLDARCCGGRGSGRRNWILLYA